MEKKKAVRVECLGRCICNRVTRKRFWNWSKKVEHSNDIVESILVSRLGMGEANAYTNTANRVVQLVRLFWIEGQRIEDLLKATVDVRALME